MSLHKAVIQIYKIIVIIKMKNDIYKEYGLLFLPACPLKELGRAAYLIRNNKGSPFCPEGSGGLPRKDDCLSEETAGEDDHP